MHWWVWTSRALASPPWKCTSHTELVPSANEETVRRLYRAWQKDGFGVVPELMDAEIEYVNPPDAIEPGIRHGHEGFATAARALLTVYENYDVLDARFYEAGDSVAVVTRVATRSRGNAVPIEAERGYVFDIRKGKVTRFAWFNDGAQALDAIGVDG
jgi:ketosteroid isomerase-like protein